MFYALYLVGILGYILSGIGRSPMDFIDRITGIYILAPCILVLLCTKSFSAFGRSFLMAFGKKGASQEQYEESLQTVRMVMFTALLSGGLCFLIGTINSWRSLSIGPRLEEGMVWLLLDTIVAMLSLFYHLLLCLLLLPLPFLLDKQLLLLKAGNGQGGDGSGLQDDDRSGTDGRPQGSDRPQDKGRPGDSRPLNDGSKPQSDDVQPLQCAVVHDLLSAYIQGKTSQETDADIQAHLEDCGSCRDLYRDMRSNALNRTAPH